MTAPHLTPKQVNDRITDFLLRRDDPLAALYTPRPEHQRWCSATQFTIERR